MGDLLGLITIGQSPRPDFEAEFRRYAPDASIRLLGALDDCSESEIDGMAGSDEYPLLVRLRGGGAAEIPLQRILPHVERCAHELDGDGASLLVVLCAGGFPEFPCSAPLLLPGKLMPAIAGALSRHRRIGIVTPIKGQIEAARAKWEADGFDVRVTSASPLRHEEVERAAREMTDPTLDLIVLDCMGHGQSYRQVFARRCGLPVLLAQSAVAKIAGELLGSDPLPDR